MTQLRAPQPANGQPGAHTSNAAPAATKPSPAKALGLRAPVVGGVVAVYERVSSEVASRIGMMTNGALGERLAAARRAMPGAPDAEVFRRVAAGVSLSNNARTNLAYVQLADKIAHPLRTSSKADEAAEPDTTKAREVADAIMRIDRSTASPAAKAEAYKQLLTPDIAGLTTDLRLGAIEVNAGQPVTYAGDIHWQGTLGETLLARTQQQTWAMRGVTSDPATMRAYLADRVARGAANDALMTDVAHYAKTFFAHSLVDTDYSSREEDRVRELPAIVNQAAVDLSGRRRIDCEGFHYLTRSLLEGAELGGRFSTHAIQLPDHIATLVDGNDGAHWAVSNTDVTPLGSDAGYEARAVAAASGGQSTFYEISSTQQAGRGAESLYDARSNTTRPMTRDDYVALGMTLATSDHVFGTDTGLVDAYLNFLAR